MQTIFAKNIPNISSILFLFAFIMLVISLVASQCDGIYKSPFKVLKKSKVLRYSFTS